MSLDEIRQRLKFMNLAKVSRSIGVHRETLSRFMRGDSTDFSASVYLKLTKFFQEIDSNKKD